MTDICRKSREVPFSTFRGTLRQVNAAVLGPRVRATFDHFFPGFQSEEDAARHWAKGGIRQRISGEGATLVGRGRERRYAGDMSFPRSRYYAVADEPAGDPSNNSLLCEVFAYASPWTPLAPVLLDSEVDVDAIAELRRLGLTALPTPALIQIISPERPGILPPSLGIDAGGTTVVPYHMSVTRTEIENVLDLRLKGTAEWFTHFFVHKELKAEEGARRTDGLSFGRKKPIHEFSELLPTLLSQQRGGGSPFLQGVGEWLRRYEANGLVYPSARTDSGVEMIDSQLIRHWGFLFVDFRGSGTPKSGKGYFGRMTKWQRCDGYTISTTETGRGAGSWSVSGLRDLQVRRFSSKRNKFSSLVERVHESLEAHESRLQEKIDKWPEGFAVPSSMGLSIGEFVSKTMAAAPRPFLEDEVLYDGASWFVHRLGADAEVLIICPACLAELIWPVLRGNPPNRCPTCSFSNGEPETPESLRDRFLPWARSD